MGFNMFTGYTPSLGGGKKKGGGGFFSSIWGGITGSEDVYGSKPEIPKFPTSKEILEEGIGANLAAFPKAEELAGKTTTANQAILDAAWKKLIPGYGGITGTIEKNIASQLRGELPSDVSALVSRKTAAQSAASGYAGSGMGRNLEARDLGLTSLQLTQQGLDSATRWLGFSRAARMSEPIAVQSMFLTPQQQIGLTEDRFNRDLLEAKVEAAPDPGAAGAFNSFMSLIGMALSAYSGGPGWQGTRTGQESYAGGGYSSPPPGTYQSPWGSSNMGGWHSGRGYYSEPVRSATDANAISTGAAAGLGGFW